MTSCALAENISRLYNKSSFKLASRMANSKAGGIFSLKSSSSEVHALIHVTQYLSSACNLPYVTRTFASFSSPSALAA